MIKFRLDKILNHYPDTGSLYVLAEKYNQIAPTVLGADDRRISITAQGLNKYRNHTKVPDIITSYIISLALGVPLEKLVVESPIDSDVQGLEEVFNFDDNVKKHLGTVTKKVREFAGYTQKEVVENIDISTSYVKMLESGNSQITLPKMLMYMRKLGLQPYIERTIKFRDAGEVFFADGEQGRKTALKSLYNKDKLLSMAGYAEILGITIQDVMSIWSRLIVLGELPIYKHNIVTADTATYKLFDKLKDKESILSVANKLNLSLSIVAGCWSRSVSEGKLKWVYRKYDQDFNKLVDRFTELRKSEPALTDYDYRVLLDKCTSTTLYRIKSLAGVGFANEPPVNLNPMVLHRFKEEYNLDSTYESLHAKTGLRYTHIGVCWRKGVAEGWVKELL